MKSDALDARVSLMSAAYDRLRGVTTMLTEKAEELETIAPDVDILKGYVVSQQWLYDFEADERGEISPGVNRSILSEDGLYNLLEELEVLMHTFERLLDRFASDSELEK